MSEEEENLEDEQSVRWFKARSTLSEKEENLKEEQGQKVDRPRSQTLSEEEVPLSINNLPVYFDALGPPSKTERLDEELLRKLEQPLPKVRPKSEGEPVLKVAPVTIKKPTVIPSTTEIRERNADFRGGLPK